MDVETVENTGVVDGEQVAGMQQGSRRRLMLFSIFAFSILLILNNGSIVAAEHGDQAMWDYMAQSILRGQVPYRDVVNIKTPLSAYIGALAILGKGSRAQSIACYQVPGPADGRRAAGRYIPSG